MERRPGDWGGEANIQDNVTGYTISYEVYDPAAKETKVYSYEATSFLLAQSQIVPIGTPVTLTAICKSPYEVSKWSSGDGYTAVELEGSEGSTSKTAVKGNRATLTVTSTAYTSVTVYVDGVRKVTPPTEEELVENKDFVFGKENGAVIVDCLSKEEHTDGSFGLKQGTFAISELQGNSSDGYKVTVTINNEDAYVDEYEASCQNIEHTRKDTTNAKTITLNWVVVQQDDGTYKSQWKAEEPATIEVTCKDNTPTVPDDDTIKELLDQKVTVKCTNDANPHDTMFKTYGALVGGYEVGELKGNATQGYSVDVTIQCDTYVTQYNTDTKSKHVLESNESKTKTITLCYDMAAAAWVKPEQTVINVTCKVDKPDSPDDETVQDLLKNKVLVKCVNTAAAHGEKTYDLEDGTYQIGTVQGDEKTGYTVDVTITNSEYLAKFNTDLKAKHELVSEKESTVTLRYVADSKTWKVDTELPVEILVTCKDVEAADIVVTPADMTIYRGGDATEETNSHVTIVDKDGKPMGNDGSLPEIGYSLKLSQELNERLHTALNLEPDAVLDLSKYITLTGKTATGETLTWKLEPYGEGSSVSSTTKDGYFIYKITPTVGSDSAKLRVSFMDSDGNYVNTDAFNIEDDNTLDQTYRMKIYGDRVDASTLYATIKYDNGTSETVSVQGAEEPATLKVRYTEPDADVNKSFETVAQASEKEDGNDQTKLSNAYMIRGGVNDFMINNSNVQVSAGNVSLLVDDIAKTAGTNFEETLEKGAVDAVKQAHPEVDTSKLQTAAKYMDLVDATNGNAWVTTKEKVTVYLPFPEGTDASTKFYVAHFDGLDREGSVSEITADVNKAAAELMGDVKADKYGISFTTNSFSPYVLVWDTTKNQPTPPSGGDNDNNNNNNNNNNNTNSNTNNNTQNTTVTVNNTASAAAPAAQAAAIPQTGDTMPVGLLGGVAVVAAAAFVVLLVIRKRKHND